MGTTGAFVLGMFVVLSGKGEGTSSHFWLLQSQTFMSGDAPKIREARSISIENLKKSVVNDGYSAWHKAYVKMWGAKKVSEKKEREAYIQDRITSHLDGIASRSGR